MGCAIIAASDEALPLVAGFTARRCKPAAERQGQISPGQGPASRGVPSPAGLRGNIQAQSGGGPVCGIIVYGT